SFGPQLLPQGVQPGARHHRAPAQDPGALALAHPIFQPETGRSIDPVPARGLQSPCTLLGALTPLVPFANVPCVNLHYQREGVLRQRQHLGRTLSATHLLIQLLTLFFCTLALPTSLPIQRSG